LTAATSHRQLILSFINKLGEWAIPFAIVFTKTDKNKPGATIRNVDAFLDKLKETWEAPPLFFLTSAIKADRQKRNIGLCKRAKFKFFKELRKIEQYG
jgi:GTP-binding protein EngB required for normal cell division